MEHARMTFIATVPLEIVFRMPYMTFNNGKTVVCVYANHWIR